MSTEIDSNLLQRALAALRAQDPKAKVEIERDSALRVHSNLDSDTVLDLLQAASIPAATTAEPERSDCCGGCCGSS